jgi:Uncharacterized conserved protein
VHQVNVVGVRVELPSNQPIVLLKEASGERYLPIWIGAVEAAAIAAAQQGMLPPRPLTHDLLKNVLDALSAPLEAVQITQLRDSVFYADLVFANGARVSARPSDAIALAMRVGVSIFADESVLTEAGVTLPEEDAPEEVQAETEVERFREFLDTISPEDFASGS